MLQHQTMVGSQVRFTFSTVNHHTLRFECRRRRKFHLGWEASATHADYTHIGHFLINLFRSQITLLHQRVSTVNTLEPLIALYINEDGGFGIATGIDDGVNL